MFARSSQRLCAWMSSSPCQTRICRGKGRESLLYDFLVLIAFASSFWPGALVVSTRRDCSPLRELWIGIDRSDIQTMFFLVLCLQPLFEVRMRIRKTLSVLRTVRTKAQCRTRTHVQYSMYNIVCAYAQKRALHNILLPPQCNAAVSP
jgi:hypothetical protein